MTEPAWAVRLGERLTELRKDPAALAACRRGVGKTPMSVPEMWPYVVPIVEMLPERGRWPVECAVHNAFALYAMHQQSKETPMHQPGGHGLGVACHLLKQKTGSEGVDRRFHAAVTADSEVELVGHLRGLVTQLRGGDIPLDWSRLAQEIAGWSDPFRRSKTQRRWGLEFHAVPVSNEKE